MCEKCDALLQLNSEYAAEIITTDDIYKITKPKLVTMFKFFIGNQSFDVFGDAEMADEDPNELLAKFILNNPFVSTSETRH